MLWVVVDFLPVVVGRPNPTWFTVVSLVWLVGAACVGVVVFGLVGELGGRVGGWLAARTGGGRQPPVAG